MKHLLGIEALTRAEILTLLSEAKNVGAMTRAAKRELLRGSVMVSMFFEPSTRTRLSFETAALQLGCGVTGFSDAQNTSATKGESLEDTVRMCAAYGDALILRHPLLGAAHRAAAVSNVPVINAGDGAGEHPTQTLVDLYTMQQRLGDLDGLRVGLAGDLCNGRTVHSLLLALAKFRNIKVSCFSPTPALALPESQRRHATLHGIDIDDADSLATLAQRVDVLYMTRVQTERISGSEPFDAVAKLEHYVLRAKDLAGAAPNMCVMHPLPRVREIATDVDALPHAAYFEQAGNAVSVRQALLLQLLR
jgi:aspartate carbamoyltransferase catalytic subunit